MRTVFCIYCNALLGYIKPGVVFLGSCMCQDCFIKHYCGSGRTVHLPQIRVDKNAGQPYGLSAEQLR